MADNGGAITNQNSASGISLLMREDEEFQEGEVWDVMNEKEKGEEDSTPKQRKSFPTASSSSLSAAWCLPFPSAQKMTIPMAKTCVNEGKKLAADQSSAPLKIPDWSQIYMKKLNRGFWGIHGKNEEMKTDHGYFVEFEDDDDDDEMIPPHEFIDRRLARTRIASYSMFEGIGRTLKGRDLCKFRNAVLIRTGFLEQ